MKTQSTDICEYCVRPLPIPEKEEHESERDFARRKTQAILTHHGLDPVAIDGYHRILHTISLWIPCRRGNAKTDVSNYAWSGAYQKAEPATV
jgi:hypothetical protein